MLYNVFHKYDVDGGFGDAVPRKDLIATFETYDLANSFVNAFANVHVYSSPCSHLMCGELIIEEVKIYTESDFETISSNFRPWWKPSTDNGINTDFDVRSMFKRMDSEQRKKAEQDRKNAIIESIYKCDDNSRIAYWDKDN